MEINSRLFFLTVSSSFDSFFLYEKNTAYFYHEEEQLKLICFKIIKKKGDTWLASKFIKRSSAITYMYDSDKRNTFCYPSIRIAKNYANLHQSRSLELFYTRKIYIK